MKRLLITGASGFLGSRIALFYKEKYIIFTPTHQEMDIADEESIYAVFNQIKPDVVIHCAAISDTGRCEKEPKLSWDMNAIGSVNVAKVAREISAKCIVCSSDQVYFGSLVQGTHSETESLLPHNIYGRDKHAAEQQCLKANPDCVCLRLSWMYDTKVINVGEHGDFFRTFMERMKSGEQHNYAVYDTRGISDVNEVVLNLEKCFDLPGGVYNFGSSNDKNMYETMRCVFTNLGLDQTKLEPNEVVFREKPRNISMSQEKANKHGIFFTTTVENLTLNIEKALEISQ